MTKSLKVLLACFLGAGIGTLTALQINGYFWWIGLLVGGFIGYISYEFKIVLRACKNAWKVVIGFRITKEQRRVFFKWWFGVGMVLIGCISLILTCAIGVTILYFLKDKAGFFNVIFWISFSSAGLMSLVMTAGSLGETMMGDEKEREEWVDVIIPFLRYNAFRIYLWIIPKFLFQSLKWLSINFPKYAPKVIIAIRRAPITVSIAIYRFVKHVFVEIHSDERLLCGIDSAIGTVIGYFAGNALIGAITGGAFGVLNYEIVSKRILHLNASKIKNT